MRNIFYYFFVLSVMLLFACQAPAPQASEENATSSFLQKVGIAPLDGGFQQEDYWVWGGCPIKGEDGKYHLFVSRWEKDMPFFIGYIFQSEIVRAVSDTPEGPYEFAEVVLGPRGKQYWDGRMTHNPTIRKYGDQYLLFYIGTTYDFDKPVIPVTTHDTAVSQAHRQLRKKAYRNIRIGMATSQSVLGPWERLDEPILDVRPEKWDSMIVTNPAPFIGKDDEIYLIYRSNTPEGLRLGIAKAEHEKAPFERIWEEPIFHFDDSHFCEDPFVWWNGERYEVIMKDLTGEITGEKHAGVHGYAEDVLSWKIAADAKAYSRKIQWEDGTLTMQGSFERPQLLLDEDHRPTHLFAATGDGPGGFRNTSKTWCMVVPLDGNK